MADRLSAIEIGDPNNADGCIIWMHGLGANGHDFEPIVPELGLPSNLKLRFVFPHAPQIPVTINNGMVMPAWYDITSMDMNREEDVAGYDRSQSQIVNWIEHEIAAGIPAEKIIIAGFSQGGVIALHTALRSERQLGGVIALSTYLGDAKNFQANASSENKATPIFFAHGTADPVVPYMMGKMSADLLKAEGYNLEWQDYPMQHAVCAEEITHIGQFITRVINA